jgi:hypothetical protein
MYGDSKVQFKKNGDGVVLVPDRDRFYQTLAKEIIDERDKGRPVLVYFETVDKVQEFVDSEYGCRLQDIVRVTEKTENIPFFVNKATGARTVTLFPRVFGRGLDFVSRDPAVDTAGGVHVIQTFFSQYVSEEIQIRGRTARQAKSGSFKMILLRDELLVYGLTVDELEQHYSTNTFYDTLDAKRRAAVTFKVAELAGKAVLAGALHKKSVDFLGLLQTPSPSKQEIVDAMMSFESAGGGGAKHVIFCLDDSGSMRGDWEPLLQSVDEFLNIREEKGGVHDRISVIQFNTNACLSMDSVALSAARLQCSQLRHRSGGTSFSPPLRKTMDILRSNQAGMSAVVVFMTDGECSDSQESISLARDMQIEFQDDFQFFGLAFRTTGGSLLSMTQAAGGTCVSAGNVTDLKAQFQDIARTVSANQGKRG